MHKIYLDTCIVSGLAKNDLGHVEQPAAIELLKLNKKGEISLVTAATTLDEINKIPESFRQVHVDIYSLLLEIPVCPQKRIRDMLGVGFIPFPREDPILTILKEILPDEMDQNHMLNALGDRCNYFVTTDGKTILCHKEQINKAFSEFTVLKPSEVIGLFTHTGS